MSRVCDGTADCVDSADESSCPHITLPDVTTTSSKVVQTYEECPDEWTLCNVFDTFCFPNSNICVFNRGLYSSVHCHNTEYLRFCRQHQCPTMFKCKASYCIPSFMVCDGILDCPVGEDEEQCGSIACPGNLIENNK